MDGFIGTLKWSELFVTIFAKTFVNVDKEYMQNINVSLMLAICSLTTRGGAFAEW